MTKIPLRARSIFLFSVLVTTSAAHAQEQPAGSGLVATNDYNTGAQVKIAAAHDGNAAAMLAADPSTASAPKPASPSEQAQQKLGLFNLTVNWRFRTEAWDWFEPSVPAQNAYAFEHSLLRVGLGQKFEKFEWFVEGAQDAIVDLPTSAVLSGRPGQLGLGAAYFVANGNGQNNANGFVRQAYLGFNLPANARFRIGRFTFLDGAEVAPKDKSLATLVNARITQRLIGDFGFSAVGRSFDGARLDFDTGAGTFTLLGARPTRGVYQIDAMGELNIDLFYGAWNVPVNLANSSGSFRLFSLGYIDERSSVLKTDNRSTALRSADHQHIRIGTYGADYVHVFRAQNAGQFDFLLWGAVQNGSWGMLTQRAGAFVAEGGWQPRVSQIKPWLRAGYSYGSGDSDPADGTHKTFFQVLPTPRPYARFPFYNMMNNEDFFGSATFRLPHSFVLRSELHALRVANRNDLWYGGGGAFQPRSFGYTGRATAGNRSLANVWDISMDVPLRYGLTLTTYYAHAWGKSVVESIYPAGTNAQFGYVETNFHF